MTRSMYDSVNPASIPADATMVAGYVDGHYANMTAMAARFPHATLVPIAVFPSTDDGLVLDVETGDATPVQAPGWVVKRRSHGVDPTVYCNTDTWPAVRRAFAAAGVPEPHYWIAQYDGVATIPAGAVAKQYRETDAWDASIVADYWPGVDPAPAPAPRPALTPAPTGDDVAIAIGTISAGFAFDAAGNLTDHSRAAVLPIPTIGDGRWPWTLVDVSFGVDFDGGQPVRLRVAVHNASTGWRVQTVDLHAADVRAHVWLQAGDNKVSAARVPLSATDTSADTPVGWLVEVK